MIVTWLLTKWWSPSPDPGRNLHWPLWPLKYRSPLQKLTQTHLEKRWDFLSSQLGQCTYKSKKRVKKNRNIKLITTPISSCLHPDLIKDLTSLMTFRASGRLKKDVWFFSSWPSLDTKVRGEFTTPEFRTLSSGMTPFWKQSLSTEIYTSIRHCLNCFLPPHFHYRSSHLEIDIFLGDSDTVSSAGWQELCPLLPIFQTETFESHWCNQLAQANKHFE